MSAVRSSIRRSAIASTSIPSIPSVPLISASPSLARSCTGDRPAAASASAAGISAPDASRTSPSPISASAQCASGARSPEQPSEPYSRTTGVIPADSSDASSCAVSRRIAGVAGGQRREPQQHQAAHDLALDLGAGARGVRADQRALELLAQLARDVAGREGAEPRRDPVRRGGGGRELLDHGPGAVDRGERVLGQRHRGPVPGHRDHVVEGHRTHAHLHGLHVAIQLPGRSIAPPPRRPGCLGSETDGAADGSPLRGVGGRPLRSTVERSRAVRAHGGSSPCRPG